MNDQMPVKLKPKENQRVEEMKALEKSKYPPVIILFSGIIWVFWRFTWLDSAGKRKSLPGFGKDERNSGSSFLQFLQGILNTERFYGSIFRETLNNNCVIRILVS